ncbi:hypothetical protein FNV43_RR20900 [Rhamnella rubrinervis]|uniref:Uncharacterized protein n=1 Tax=Rhamnella rubrinervis TaxID=2594499 RepID=A0A8K0GTV0_9ROSA|nr:hypothetical protein FNV43_RR20900 [Rhamnella rubrinervis]
MLLIGLTHLMRNQSLWVPGSMVARLKLKGIDEGHHRVGASGLNLTQHGKLTSPHSKDRRSELFLDSTGGFREVNSLEGSLLKPRTAVTTRTRRKYNRGEANLTSRGMHSASLADAAAAAFLAKTTKPRKKPPPRNSQRTHRPAPVRWCGPAPRPDSDVKTTSQRISRSSMKNEAKCVSWCELRNPGTIEVFER